MRADDVDAEDLVVFFLGDDFDEAVGFAEDAGFARGREREFADLYVVTGFFCFRFGQSHAGDLRVAVGTVRDEVLLDRLDLFAGDLFDDHDAFFRSEMGEPSGVDHVADGEDVRLVGFAILVDLDRAAGVDDDLGFVEAEFFEIRHATHRDEQHLGFKRNGLAFCVFTGNLNAFLVLFKLIQLDAGLAFDALLFECAGEFL